MKSIATALFCLLTPLIVSAQRLPRTTFPTHYKLTLAPDFVTDRFSGEVVIDVSVQRPIRQIVLHALEIEFKAVTIDSAGKSQKAVVELDPEAETATLTLADEIPAGPATIRIQYLGILNDQLRGFYLGRAGNRKYAATQLEATDARRAFPSFDEPAMKATFDLTMVVDRGDTAISNMAAVSDTPGPEGKHTIRFATTPRMSTYLVAIVVGDFKCIESSADGIPLRICGAPDRVQYGRYAMKLTEGIVKYYNRYYGIRYPFGKLDQIALADFQAGAMENTGAITYRDSLLLIDETQAPFALRKVVASVIAHEIAHMWFGDLVTMEWWDDIWLNEGFASWMENKPVAELHPDWNIFEREIEEISGPIAADVLVETRPVQVRAETPEAINELFDSITYSKGSAVLKMLETYIGEEIFRIGVNNYLAAHAYGNATSDDFTASLSNAAGKPLDAIMDSFIKQPGVPLVKFRARCIGSETEMTLEQSRLFIGRASSAKDSPELWQIPICWRDPASGKSGCELMTAKQQTFRLPGCAPDLVANASGTGYYVVEYEPKEAASRLASIRGSLLPAERLAFLRDEWFLVRANRRSLGDYLDLVEKFQNERNGVVVAEILTTLGKIDGQYVDDSNRVLFRAWVRSLLTPIAKELGWKPGPGESEERKALRASVLFTLGVVGQDPAVRREARKLAESYLRNPKSVDPSISDEILKIAAAGGDTALLGKLIAHLEPSTSAQEVRRLLSWLPLFEDPAVLRRVLELSLTDTVRNQDSPTLFARVLENRAGRQMAWDFLQQRWSEVEKKTPKTSTNRIVGALSYLCSDKDLQAVERFFSEHPVPDAERTLRQAKEKIATCTEFQAAQSENLAQWLSKRVKK